MGWSSGYRSCGYRGPVGRMERQMKHKVSELEGALLDAAVAKALGHRDLQLKNGEWRSRTDDGELSPIAAFSENWAAGGPIIERERIGLLDCLVGWEACAYSDQSNNDRDIEAYGRTPLIAAMRAFVASKFGEEVDL
jgi:hypothetical protein